MRATKKAWGRVVRSGRLSAALGVAALPILALSVSGTASAATRAKGPGCKPGSGVHLVGKRLTNAEIQSYSDNGRLRCADLAKANLSGLSLIQADLSGANLRKANLTKADLGQATLSHAQLQGAKIRSADLIQATMIGTNFSGADGRSAKFGQATMTGANLSKAVLISADFGQATISKANFTSANLTKASLDQAVAKGTNFSKANLTSASFISADLTGAHFKGAKGVGTDFTSATSPPATASGGGGPNSVPGLPGIGTKPTVSGPPIDKGQWQSYLLIGSAVLFALMAAASVRRFFSARVRSAFLNRGFGGGYGLGGSYGPYGQGGSFGPYGQGGGFNQGGGGFNQGGGFGPGPGGSAFDTQPGGGYGPMPGVGGPGVGGGILGGGANASARPFRLVLAVIGALVVAIGIWLLGTAVMNAVLVPVGSAFQLCESTCSSRFGGSVPVSIVVGVVVMIVGGVLRRIGTVRFYY
jgi:uncharacterized protein YjbI with pentapeptide repeats